MSAGSVVVIGVGAALVAGLIYAVHKDPRGRIPGAREESTEVQTLLFPRDEFTVAQAKAWAKKWGYKYSKVDVKPNTIRIRQWPPSDFKARSFRTVSLGDRVKAVIGRVR